MAENHAEEHFLEKVEQPDPNDILCGKDKNCVHAPGSIRFRKIIESYRERYASCLTKFDKMLITKEIYETLSESSRFLKYNSKEKMWEEISPMAARDKCGHALRFANRTKTKASKKKDTETQQYAAPTATAAPATSTSASVPPKSVSPSATSVNSLTTVAATPASVSASVSPTAGASQQAAAPQLGAPAPAMLQPQTQLWGELAKRYNSLWSATQIPVLAGGLRSPIAAPGVLGNNSAAISALAAAAAVRSNPSLMASIANAPASLNATNATASATANAFQRQVLINALSAPSAAPSPALTQPHPRRRPTLDDLCSIINAEQVYANPTSGN